VNLIRKSIRKKTLMKTGNTAQASTVIEPLERSFL